MCRIITELNKREPFSKLPIFPHCIKARTRLHRIQIVMPHYQRLRKVLLQLPQQGKHGRLLLLRACVCGLPLRGQSALIADTYGVAIVTPAMRSNLFQRTAAVNFSVARHVEMVTDVLESPMPDVVAAAILKAQSHALRRGRAMNDE